MNLVLNVYGVPLSYILQPSLVATYIIQPFLVFLLGNGWIIYT